MSNRDKVLVVAIGLAIGLALTAGAYSYMASSQPDYIKYMPEDSVPNPMDSLWPMVPLFVLCGIAVTYGIWASVSKKGRHLTEQRKKEHAQYVQDHREEIDKAKGAVADGVVGCALLSPCLVPVLVILAALFIGAVLFLCGVFSR